MPNNRGRGSADGGYRLGSIRWGYRSLGVDSGGCWLGGRGLRGLSIDNDRRNVSKLGVDIDRRRSIRSFSIDIDVRRRIWSRHPRLCRLAARYLRSISWHWHGDRSGNHLAANGHGAVDDLASTDCDGLRGREPWGLLDARRTRRDGRTGQGGGHAGLTRLVDCAGRFKQRRVGSCARRCHDSTFVFGVLGECELLRVQTGVAGRTWDSAPVNHIRLGVCRCSEAHR